MSCSGPKAWLIVWKSQTTLVAVTVEGEICAPANETLGGRAISTRKLLASIAQVFITRILLTICVSTRNCISGCKLTNSTGVPNSGGPLMPDSATRAGGSWPRLQLSL